MNNTDLPPLPPAGAVGSEVCNVIQLYLAVWDDLTPEEMKIVSTHVQVCADCMHEQRLLRRASAIVANLDASSPSAPVDQAVMRAIAARSRRGPRSAAQAMRPAAQVYQPPARPRKVPLRMGWLAAAAAVVVLSILTVTHFLPTFVGSHPSVASTQHTGTGTHQGTTGSQQAFAIPANLSWSNYVLYRSQTMMSTSGEPFTVTSYQNLANGNMNVETVMDGKLDVVMVGDSHEALGMDMMHHVAQWGADAWGVDGSMFDLNKLRHDLQTGSAVYEGKTTFKGKEVYRIRYANGLVLLLDMHYTPVNVLETSNNAQSGTPMYDSFRLLPVSKVPTSMWDMSVPTGFKMGQLPKKPQEVNS